MKILKIESIAYSKNNELSNGCSNQTVNKKLIIYLNHLN